MARNEERRIEDALKSLEGWTAQIIVIDNESTDATVEIARRYSALVLSAPRSLNFDAIRNLAIEHSTGDFIFYLDADERVPSALGEILGRMVQERGDQFEAMCIPFKHYFCGKWMEHSGWWPGYTRPQLLKKGRFQYNARLHSGVSVDGRTLNFPADDSDLAIVHLSYDNLNHYLGKLNNYTDGEAASLLADGQSHTWQAMLAHFVQDWQFYYEHGRADLDGMHGFVLSFMSAFYRFSSRAKLWNLRRERGALSGTEPIPQSVPEMLEFMAQVVQEGAGKWLVRDHQPENGQTNRVPHDWFAARPAYPPRPSSFPEGEPGITACILARNEEHRIEDALRSLHGWADQIIVIDNESTDNTAEIARRYGALILSAPQSADFDGLRNLAIDHSTGDWIFYLDADERVLPGLGPVLRQLVRDRGDQFEAMCLPFKNHFYGKWMQSPVWWPGYKGPQLLKRGEFRHGEAIHSGAQVQGRTLMLPADDPELAIVHNAYDNLHHYLEKLNRYTDAEAELLHAAGQTHSWQAQLAAFASDWHIHYDRLDSKRDGMHGFVQSFLCAFYRFASRAKLWDLRRKYGQANANEPVPANLREMLELMARAVVEGPEQWLRPQPSASSQPHSGLALPLVWHGPLFDASGYADDGRNLALALLEAGESLALAPQTWNQTEAGLAPEERQKLQTHMMPANARAEILVSNTLPRLLQRAPAATFQIARTVFETDRLPLGNQLLLNTMDRIWVPSTHARDTFVRSGVEPDKIAVLPEALDPAPFADSFWAEPDVDHLQSLMRQVVRQRKAARTRGDAARARITERYNRTAVGKLLCAELDYCRAQHQKSAHRRPPAPSPTFAPPAPGAPRPRPIRLPAHSLPADPPRMVNFRSALGRPLRIRWEGDQAVHSSLALVNRELCLGLLEAGDVELALGEPANPDSLRMAQADPRLVRLFAHCSAPLSGPPDVTIRHHFPPNWQRPEQGKLVVMQPWERSRLPEPGWIEGAQQADEVWAYSRFVRDCYVRSGVPAEKVRLVSLGMRPEQFTPEGPTFPLPVYRTTDLRTLSDDRPLVRFLYVGGSIDRKGADLLLEAYLRAFTPVDRVCLVVKDMGTNTFYRGQNLRDTFRQLAQDPHAPWIHYMEDDLSDEHLAALYRSCSCVVLPYRGEGFGLSPLEGMACGLPAIVTAGGPTDDYLDDTVALRVPSYRCFPRGRPLAPDVPFADEWEWEPDRQALVDALRWVYTHPDEVKERGRMARERVATAWTWQRSAGMARERLMDLMTPPVDPVALPHVPPVNAAATALKGRKVSAKARKPELSLCMIARDEEPRIASCLRSIAPYVDEMIVVDTGSADRTREIARECGARVVDLPWPNSFAEARNASLSEARGEWIFWMDADDVISAENGAGLRELVRRHPDRDAAYQVQVRIPPGPGEFSPTVVDHVKLFPNRPDLRFEYRIHEQVLPSIRRVGLPILFSDLFVTHQHYDRTDSGQEKKRQRDFHLLYLDLKDRPGHPFTLFNLGMTHLYATKEFEVAAHYLRRSLDASDWRDSIVRKAFALLVTARICQQDWNAAIKNNQEGRSYYPDDAELLFQAGQIYQEAGRFDEARRALERLIGGQEEEHYRSVDVGLRAYRGRHELALLHRRLGDAPHCAEVLRSIVADYPDYQPAKADLEETLYGLRRPQDSIQVSVHKKKSKD